MAQKTKSASMQALKMENTRVLLKCELSNQKMPKKAAPFG